MTEWIRLYARRKKLYDNVALRTCLIYASISTLWILFSDELLFRFFEERTDMAHISMVKGIAFVLTTGGIIYVLIDRWVRAVRRSEESYRTLIETSPDAIAILDLDARIVMANRRTLALAGCDCVESLIGKNILDFAASHDRERASQAIQTLIHGGELRDSEYTTMKSDGSALSIELSASLIRDEEEQPKAIMVVLRDITERNRAERELRLLAQTVACTKDCISITDLEDKILFVNDAFLGTYEYTREELIGQSVAMLRSPSTPLAISQQIRPATLHGGWYGEILNRKKNGTDFPIELWTSVVRNDAGDPVAMVGVARDAVRKKQVEESMRKLLRAIEQSDEVIFMTEPDGCITYVNPAFEKTYGYTKEEVLGKTPRILKSGLVDAEAYTEFWRKLLSGESVHLELVNKTKDGRLVTLESSANPVVDAAGAITGFIAVQNNITDRKRMQEERKALELQLFQAQKIESVGTLAGGIAHDFNNILGIILGHATLLEHAYDRPDKFVKSREAIVNAVNRGASLVQQILTFARKTEVSFETTNVNDTVVELVKMLEETFPRTITFSLQLAPTVPLVNADRTRLHQTLLNLCVNARDAMPEGGTLSVSTHRVSGAKLRTRFPDATENEFLCIKVSDTGMGMDEMTRQRLFEPFFTTKPVGKGTGLGLAVVHGIMKTHRGHVEVESAIGKGTTFRLYFPVLSNNNDHTLMQQISEDDISGGNETILLVEDEESMRELACSLLEAEGYKVLVASDGEEAMKHYGERHSEIALVLSDMGLPRMDGVAVFHRMKEINPKVKFILVSGYFEPDVKSELMKAGASKLVQKPYLPLDVLRTVREVIDAD